MTRLCSILFLAYCVVLCCMAPHSMPASLAYLSSTQQHAPLCPSLRKVFPHSPPHAARAMPCPAVPCQNPSPSPSPNAMQRNATQYMSCGKKKNKKQKKNRSNASRPFQSTCLPAVPHVAIAETEEMPMPSKEKRPTNRLEKRTGIVK